MNLARSDSGWSCGLKRSGTICFVISSVRTWSFIRAGWNRCRWQNLSQRLWFFVFALIDCNHLKTFQCYFFVRFDRLWCLRCFAVHGPTSCCCRSSSICSFRRSFCSFRSRISLVDCRHSTQLWISTPHIFTTKKLLLILEVCKRWRLVVFCSPIGRGVVTGSQMCGWGRVCTDDAGFSFLSRISSCDLCWCMD